MVKFEINGEIVGEIWGIETIATGHGIHILERLVRLYGEGNWSKLKGFATLQFEDGTWLTRRSTGSKRLASVGVR